LTRRNWSWLHGLEPVEVYDECRMASCRLAIRSRSQALLGPANPRSSRFAARSRASRECVPKQSFGTKEGLGLGGARASTPLIGGGGQVPHWGRRGFFGVDPKKVGVCSRSRGCRLREEATVGIPQLSVSRWPREASETCVRQDRDRNSGARLVEQYFFWVDPKKVPLF
jgi:hypothetical protein